MFIHMHCSLLIIHIVLFFFFSFFFFFLPALLWYTLCILFFRQTHLWNGKKKEVERKKERISWRPSLWLQTSERGKNFIIWASDRKMWNIIQWQERSRNEDIFFFFCPPLFHVCVAEKQRSHLCGPCTHSPPPTPNTHTHTHTHTHWLTLYLTHIATNHCLSFFTECFYSLHNQQHGVPPPHCYSIGTGGFVVCI